MFKWIGSMFVFLATLLFVLWGCTDSGVEQGDLEFPDSSLDRYAVSWSQVDYTVRASGFFGDTTWDHWPDNVVEQELSCSVQFQAQLQDCRGGQ